MNAKDIKTQLIRPRPTCYISPNPERTVPTFFLCIFPAEIIPYYKNQNSLCANYIYLNVVISETCFAQKREPTLSDSA